MKRLFWLVLMSVSLTGCSGLQWFRDGMGHRFSTEHKLSTAVGHLENGNLAAAKGELESIAGAPGVDGVTDEALFRLSLLSLQEKEPPTTSLQLLERLKKEYPRSPWTRQSRQLRDYLTWSDELRKQNRNLRLLNMSLSKDNKDLQGVSKENRELHQSIERLKNLDIELERKSH